MPLRYAIACIAAGALGLAYLAVMHLLFKRLASHHASTWHDLGSPEFFASLHLTTMLKVIGFLARKDYIELNDPVAARLAVGASLLLILIALGCAYLQVVFFVNGLRWPLTAAGV